MIDVTCPACGGAVEVDGWVGRGRAAGRSGVCSHCRQDVTIVVHSTYAPRPTVNKAAPFYPLVEMVDAVAWRRTVPVRQHGKFNGSRKVTA